MTRASLREYAAVQRPRDQHATRAEKRQLLNEVGTVTGLHRKAAIRLLRRAPRMPTAGARTGRPPLYGPTVATAAELLRQAAGRIGPQSLPPCVPELADRLLRRGELAVAPEIETRLRHASPATLGRLLAPARAVTPPRGLSTPRPGTWLKRQIPLRTFADWSDARPGVVEVDLVAHCDTSTQGFSLCTRHAHIWGYPPPEARTTVPRSELASPDSPLGHPDF